MILLILKCDQKFFHFKLFLNLLTFQEQVVYFNCIMMTCLNHSQYLYRDLELGFSINGS